MFALFDNLGGAELFICALVSLLIFGKRLPEVAAQAGSALTKLRRGVNDAWRDTGVDQEMRKFKDALPRDMSVSGFAREAARKFEQRVEEIAKTEPKTQPKVEAGDAVVPDDVKSAAPELRASASLEDGTMPTRVGPGPIGSPPAGASATESTSSTAFTASEDVASRGFGSGVDGGPVARANTGSTSTSSTTDHGGAPGGAPVSPPPTSNDSGTVARGSLPKD